MHELTLDMPPNATGPDIARWRHCPKCGGWKPAENQNTFVHESETINWVWNSDCRHYMLERYVRNVVRHK